MCGAALVLLGPFTPMLFMGEEWAAGTPWQFFASFPDPELADAVRTGRRREFGRHGWGESEVPDPMDVATLERSTLRWDEVDDPDHRAVLEAYRALVALRRQHPELRDASLADVRVEVEGPRVRLHRGRFTVEVDRDAESVVVRRGDEVVWSFSASGSSPRGSD